MKFGAPVALFVLLAVSVYAGASCAMQRSVLFPAPAAPARAPALPENGERWWLETEGGRVEAFMLRAANAAPGPLVLYAHGNGELIDYWVGAFAPLTRAGISALLVEYPGYGRSEGSPSEDSIREAMAAAYDRAAADPAIDAKRIAGYGRSLGGGAVCALAGERPLAALILESTFTSVRAMAARFGVVGSLVLDPFDNLATLDAFDGRVLVAHGESDTLIPIEQGEALAAAAKTELVRLRCGHNDCRRIWPEILRLGF